MKRILKIKNVKIQTKPKIFKTIVLLFVLITSSITLQAQWTQVGQDIEGKTKRDLLGSSVSISADGSIMAVGAPHELSTTTTYNGYVQVYRQNNGVWIQIGDDIEGEAIGDYFGASVSLSADGSVIAIGAPYNDGNYVGSGHVRIFKNTNDVWIQIGDDIDGGLSDDIVNGVRLGNLSGASVSLSADGSIVAIGAQNNSGINGNGLHYSGSVSIYQNKNGAWVLIGNTIHGQNEEDRLGASVSISADGTKVAVGAPYNNNSVGEVLVFNFKNNIWTQIGNGIKGEAIEDRLGFSVSLNADGSIVAIGSTTKNARVYQNNNGTWTQIGQDIIQIKKGVNVSINADGSIVAVSNPKFGLQSGYVRVYQNVNNDWMYRANNSIHGSTGDHFGTSLELTADGSMIIVGAFGGGASGIVWGGEVSVYQNTAVLSTQELSKEGIAIYPNPTSEVINLRFSQNEVSQVFIYDCTGKTVYKNKQINNNELTIDLSTFKSGMYFVKIQKDKSILSTKIVKF